MCAVHVTVYGHQGRRSLWLNPPSDWGPQAPTGFVVSFYSKEIFLFTRLFVIFRMVAGLQWSFKWERSFGQNYDMKYGGWWLNMVNLYWQRSKLGGWYRARNINSITHVEMGRESWDVPDPRSWGLVLTEEWVRSCVDSRGILTKGGLNRCESEIPIFPVTDLSDL